MGLTNEFERDLEDQAGLKRPGRIDMRIFQNTADAGDGHPGIQKCFRNYLHEGGMEKDIDLIGFSIKGTSVDISNVEMQQLSNIGSSIITTNIWSQIDNIEATTISAAQWVFVGEADQSLKQADVPTFGGLAINGNLTITGNVDSVDVSVFKTDYDNHLHDGHTLQLDNINSDGGAFSFSTTGTVTFNQDVTVPNLITTGNVDGVDVSAIKLNSMPSAADGDISANTQKIVNVVDPVNNQDVATKNFVKSYLPVGTILMYKGTGWVDNVTIVGWYTCNAANAAHGVPDLENKFIRSESSSGGSGGSDDAVVVQHNHGGSVTGAGTHTHAVNVKDTVLGPADRINIEVTSGTYIPFSVVAGQGSHGHGVSINNEGVSGTGANVPTYYSLIFIMRVS